VNLEAIRELGETVYYGNTLTAWAKAFVQFAVWFTVLPIARAFVTRRVRRHAEHRPMRLLLLLRSLLDATKRIFGVAVATWLAMRWIEVPEDLGRAVRVAILVVVWLAWMLRHVVLLIGFAALIAYALDPIVSLVQRVPLPGRRAVPRGVAAGFVILTLALIVGWSLALAVPGLARDLARFADAAPGVVARLEHEARQFVESHGWGGLVGTDESGSGNEVSLLLHAAQRWSAPLLGGMLGNLGQLLGLVLLPVLAFYLLANREEVSSSALDFVPRDLRPQAVRVMNAIDPALRAYVRGQSLVCLVMGTVMALVLKLLGFGLPPGSPSLGEILAQGKANLQAPWLGITGFLVLALMLSLLVFVGEAVRDAFDPRKTP